MWFWVLYMEKQDSPVVLGWSRGDILGRDIVTMHGHESAPGIPLKNEDQ